MRRAARNGLLLLLFGSLTLLLAYPWLARPLEYSTPIAGADAIVVLGGGVDEMGRPTLSTAERVFYGTGLWKEGFAAKLLLSTGAPEGISESQVMRRMAISLGVPEEAILLEDESLNTYENLMYTERIARREGWKRLILVSSPYHMRRISLVRRKSGPGVENLYAPVRPSAFHKPSGLSHRILYAWAVLHEYAGIAWYWAKGFV